MTISTRVCFITRHVSLNDDDIIHILLRTTSTPCWMLGDTFLHSWEALNLLLQHPDAHDILIDVGMPVRHKNVAYNCRVFFFNRKILLIRPKMFLANDGNYRESRWFTAWTKTRQVEDYYLPRIIQETTGQITVPFGDAVLSTLDTCLATELCEELFVPSSPHIPQGLDGVEIFVNGSASHHEFQKLSTRVDLIREATRKSGGIYLYSNCQGCDGERVYYDGTPMIACNGDLVAQGKQFSLKGLDFVIATLDLEAIRTYRSSFISRSSQSSLAQPYPRIFVDISLSNSTPGKISRPITPKYFKPQEEICYGPACWLWDYLRRSRCAGFFLPLSGGIDSAATALIVYSMCNMLLEAVVEDQNEGVLHDLREISGEDDFSPVSATEICNKLLHTAYLGTSNSSTSTHTRAQELARLIGCYHISFNVDSVISAIINVFSLATGFVPRYKAHGGTDTENLALQNIQARLRMLFSYLLAQLGVLARGGKSGRSTSLLVLGSANLDESLRGYFTKYDCSSADLNPIGAISKRDLRSFVEYVRDKWDMPVLTELLDVTPTAELEPSSDEYVQSDELDMGMTYEELSVFGKLRKIAKCGPFSMFTSLVGEWNDKLSVGEIANKVMRFFHYYSINRHKMTTLPPSYHMSPYNADDNRYDLRPFLYPPFTWQFQKIRQYVTQWGGSSEAGGKMEQSGDDSPQLHAGAG